MNLKKEFNRYKPYFFNLVLIWLTILFYNINNYYSNFIRDDSYTTIFYLALGYTTIGLFYYSAIPFNRIKNSKGTLIFNALKRIVRGKFKLEKIEKVAILFIIVKIFFLPIMLNFFFQNFNSVKSQLPNLLSFSSASIIPAFNLILFPFLLTLIFMIDTLWFSFGYAFEGSALNNTIRSVEPTILGWLVTLICYPPFNTHFVRYSNWFANDHINFFTPTITFIMRLCIILLLSIYVGATLALGTKCSNLTNRGIVSRGPYAIIRHPAYISKNAAWWLTLIPVLSWPAVFSMGSWSLIYHLRTITEERHLSQDPDYIEYCKNVKYRYIPGVY
ncbi:MAG: hypothetical protein ABIB79_00575 [archaeon]